MKLLAKERLTKSEKATKGSGVGRFCKGKTFSFTARAQSLPKSNILHAQHFTTNLRRPPGWRPAILSCMGHSNNPTTIVNGIGWVFEQALINNVVWFVCTTMLRQGWSNMIEHQQDNVQWMLGKWNLHWTWSNRNGQTVQQCLDNIGWCLVKCSVPLTLASGYWNLLS